MLKNMPEGKGVYICYIVDKEQMFLNPKFSYKLIRR